MISEDQPQTAVHLIDVLETSHRRYERSQLRVSDLAAIGKRYLEVLPTMDTRLLSYFAVSGAIAQPLLCLYVSEFGDYVETVHAAQRFESYGDATALLNRATLEHLETISYISSMRTGRFGTMFALRHVLFRADGDPILSAESVLLSDAIAHEENIGPHPLASYRVRAVGPMASLTTCAVPLQTSRRFGTALGDIQPIHVDKRAAEALGFRDTPVHGLHTLASCATEVLAVSGVRRPVSYVQALFAAPVYGGDQLEVQSINVEVHPMTLAFQGVSNGRVVLRRGRIVGSD